MKIAVCQSLIRKEKRENLKRAAEAVREAADNGAELVVLPEMFVCEFLPDVMRANAEGQDGETVSRLAESAGQNRVWLVGGTFPEICGTGDNAVDTDRTPGAAVYRNTCPVFSPDGRLVAKYSKQHLFDVNVRKGDSKVSSAESDLFTAGSTDAVFETGELKTGVAVCFDLRFPDLFARMRCMGAELIVVPAAFSAATGPAHWELLLRARAVDNQYFVAGAGAVSIIGSKYSTYGHSLVADPWGTVIAGAGGDEAIMYADIDRERVYEVRRQMKLLV